jgi:hypothetical protein
LAHFCHANRHRGDPGGNRRGVVPQGRCGVLAPHLPVEVMVVAAVMRQIC